MTLKIEERPALTVVGMEIVTQPKSAEIRALWPKFVARIGDIQDPREAMVSYGVMWHGESMHVMHYIKAVNIYFTLHTHCMQVMQCVQCIKLLMFTLHCLHITCKACTALH